MNNDHLTRTGIGEINLDEASFFIELLTGAPDAVLTFQTFDDDSDRKLGQLISVLHGTLLEHADKLKALNEAGAGIFVMVNEGDLQGRKAANVVAVRALFVDLDGAPIEPALESAVPPDIVVSSSPGRYHAYWTGWDCSLEDFRQAQRALINKFHADPSVNDLPRVMRLPGFYHRKSEPYLVRVLR